MPKLPNTPKNQSACVCAGCPSYNECAKGNRELLYCADGVGKSGCEYSMNGCICGGCPIYERYKLKSGYYCVHGSAAEIDK